MRRTIAVTLVITAALVWVWAGSALAAGPELSRDHCFVAWNPVTTDTAGAPLVPGVSGYNVYFYDVTAKPGVPTISTGPTGTVLNCTGLLANGQHYVQVAAYNSELVEGAHSTELPFTYLLPAVPAGVTNLRVGTTEVLP